MSDVIAADPTATPLVPLPAPVAFPIAVKADLNDPNEVWDASPEDLKTSCDALAGFLLRAEQMMQDGDALSDRGSWLAVRRVCDLFEAHGYAKLHTVADLARRSTATISGYRMVGEAWPRGTTVARRSYRDHRNFLRVAKRGLGITAKSYAPPDPKAVALATEWLSKPAPDGMDALLEEMRDALKVVKKSSASTSSCSSSSKTPDTSKNSPEKSGPDDTDEDDVGGDTSGGQDSCENGKDVVVMRLNVKPAYEELVFALKLFESAIMRWVDTNPKQSEVVALYDRLCDLGANLPIEEQE